MIISLYAFPEYFNFYMDFFNCIQLWQMYFKAFKAIS